METQVKNFQTTFAIADKVNKVALPVAIQTVQDLIVGEIYVRPVVRVIDDLIHADQFLAITNAVVHDKTGSIRYRSDFMIINRDHIVFLIPKQEMIYPPE
jgi:hypothetical protein